MVVSTAKSYAAEQKNFICTWAETTQGRNDPGLKFHALELGKIDSAMLENWPLWVLGRNDSCFK